MTSEKNAAIALADGTVVRGKGLGAQGETVGELCFNTSMTGYQEILTDPSYRNQIITFTFPHVGNVGVNPDDIETSPQARGEGVRGCLMRAHASEPSNYRATESLNQWLKKRGIIAISGIDTRSLTIRIRTEKRLHAALAFSDQNDINHERLVNLAAQWRGLEGQDLASHEGCGNIHPWSETSIPEWNSEFPPRNQTTKRPKPLRVVAIDFGIKREMLRQLVALGCETFVVPAAATAKDILDLNPDGALLSNGPGDPAAAAVAAADTIRELLRRRVPIFGICLGHQLLAHAVGAKTLKLPHGHHGANHPVQELRTGRVEIASINHCFAVDPASLPDDAKETHKSLFDGTNCGLELLSQTAFSVQHHPEASPGPRDARRHFRRFVDAMRN